MKNASSIVNGFWAVAPGIMADIHTIFDRHVSGEVADLSAIAAKLGRPIIANNNSSIMSIVDGVAVITIEGVLVQKGNMFSDVSGATSMQIIGNCFNQAVSDPAVKGIVLYISSGGGQVAGTSELSDTIYRGRSSKKIICFSDNNLCSAALWIGSAAHSVYLSSESVNVGSVGVCSGHVDRSGAEAMKGTKTTEVSSGKFKRITSQYEPLTDEGRAEIQAQVDFLQGIFVAAIARNRGISTKKVKDSEARVYLGSNAISAGFADGFSTLPAIIASIKAPDKSNVLIGQRGAVAHTPVIGTNLAIKPPATTDAAERAEALAAIAEGGNPPTHGDLAPRQYVKTWAERNGIEANTQGGMPWVN
jgi:signal peptide peptidase SppA